MKKLALLFAISAWPFILVSQVVPEWIKLYDNPQYRLEYSTAMAVDPGGNVIIAGVAVSAATNTTDYLVVKYNSGGIFQWAQTYNGTGNFDDLATAVATDATGNVFVTGGADLGATDKDFLTIKYTADGSFGWGSAYKGLGDNDDDVASDVATDAAGFVYVTGSSAGYASSMWTDFATLKYTPGGDTVWTRRLGDGGMGNDRAMALAVDEKGYVYVTGYVAINIYDYATVKYKPNGDTAWVRTYNGTGNDEDRAYAIAVDGDRNVYITGTSWGQHLDDYATVKYDSNGVQKWVARYNGPVNSYDKAWDLKLDPAGNVYVTGSSGGTGINYDICTIKYNPDGGEEWVARYNGPDNFDDLAAALAVDASGNVFVTGSSQNAPSPYIKTTDLVTVKYNTSGATQWSYRYNGPGNYHDQGIGVAVNASGDAYVTGRTDYYQQPNEADVVTLKFGSMTGLGRSAELDPVRIYPNPAKDVIFIQTDLDPVQIAVLNSLGQAVYAGSPMGSREPGGFRIRVPHLPGGLYFLKIHTSETVFSLPLTIVQ